MFSVAQCGQCKSWESFSWKSVGRRKRAGQIEVARFLGCADPVDVIVSKWEASVAGDNKTKATNVEIDVPREELWTRRALDLYKRAGFEELEKYFV